MKTKKEKTKVVLSISMDRNLYDVMNDKIINNSKYIEWLIYQDLSKNSNDDEIIQKIII